ncbi:GIN domain-containing protein [Pedobacter sp. L105]|uniref:GIN domain-containing protein n=1 Tax=Pedobacter sp. L105 TaxID=1641871 RepID=UPI00131DAB42|nr:DUF2807 domain-containing protein [Pedobacter sp. L105]
MNKLILFTAVVSLFTWNNLVAQEVKSVDPFDKVIISPHVQATFIKGDKESVTVESCTVDKNKIHIESNGKTLRVYLEGAKEITKNEKSNDNGVKKSIYQGTVLTVTVSYKYLEELSVRGEENILLKSKLEQEDFGLNIYGTSMVSFNEVQLRKMTTTIYGESHLEIKTGAIAEQKFTAYGESKVDVLGVKGATAKATLYGESELNLNVSDEIKVTSFGDAKINYKGSPNIRKGINVGNPKIYQIK